MINRLFDQWSTCSWIYETRGGFGLMTWFPNYLFSFNNLKLGWKTRELSYNCMGVSSLLLLPPVSPLRVRLFPTPYSHSILLGTFDIYSRNSFLFLVFENLLRKIIGHRKDFQNRRHWMKELWKHQGVTFYSSLCYRKHTVNFYCYF